MTPSCCYSLCAHQSLAQSTAYGMVVVVAAAGGDAEFADEGGVAGNDAADGSDQHARNPACRVLEGG